MSPVAAERDANIARIANQHAEAILAHAAHVNCYNLTDEQFDAFVVELRNRVAETLQQIDTRVLAAELPADDPARLFDRHGGTCIARHGEYELLRGVTTLLIRRKDHDGRYRTVAAPVDSLRQWERFVAALASGADEVNAVHALDSADDPHAVQRTA